MGKIQVLDEHIANQIAAGEVVERPASVVKELVENSIDANSTKIDIAIGEGGLNYISVKDNGEGIEDDDIEVAFFRHATSKIKSGRDLFRISSLGFRGEALPSIAAVSKLTLKTSGNNKGIGAELNLEGGNIISKKQIAYARGTEIIIKDIFFNTPARLKYMKSLQTEIGHIIDYINRLSLAYPNIAFTLKHNDNIILTTTGDGKLLHTIAAIYGTSTAKNMIPFNDENLDFKISGFVSKPEITRANKSHISIFVNGRYIKNHLLNQAIIKGYNTLLMVNRYPIVVLKIDLDFSLVDVNVHPAKLEVRFSKEQEIMKFIEQTIYKALSNLNYIPEPATKKIEQQQYQKPVQAEINFKIKEAVNSFFSSTKTENIGEEKITIESTDNTENKEVNKEFEQVIESDDFQKDFFSKDKLPYLDPVAQINGTYIVAQNENGLYLIDQHAAHERIQYEKNLKLLNEETITSQELLIPITIDYTHTEIQSFLTHLDTLKDLGIEIELFGKQTLIVRSTPLWFPKGQELIFIDKMLHMLVKSNSIDIKELRNDLIANTSCKSAIKANHSLSKKEMENLLEQLRITDNPFTCPHGRPVIIHFSFYDIEKMFKRVV